MVACSPALIIVSGYHGNTDPVFIMFTFVSFYLLFRTRSAFLAGLAFALAMSVKIVPDRGAAGAAAPRCALGAEAPSREFLVGQRRRVRDPLATGVRAAVDAVQDRRARLQGLYRASGGSSSSRPSLGFSRHSVQTLQDSGRLTVAGARGRCSRSSSRWRRKDATIPAFGLSLVLVLLLSTATVGRYTVWAVAAAFLINFWAAAIYDIAVRRAPARRLFDRWSHGPPWDWDKASATPWTHHEVFLAGVVWFAHCSQWRSWESGAVN